MTEAEIQILKDSVDRAVEIRTSSGECLIAKVLFVSQFNEYDEHDVLYEVISSNKIDSYRNLEKSGGYVLDFQEIISVNPAPTVPTEG